jgi:hypothetical protein
VTRTAGGNEENSLHSIARCSSHPRSDDAKCARNYGDDWKEYTKLVPYVFIPGVI